MKEKLRIISLIGMTGVGKTTVGKCLSEKSGREFLDLDLIINKKTEKTPSEIFASYGEEAFRNIETEELLNIFEKYYKYNKNIILSCGGGIILKEANRDMLKKNSFVVWLLRPVGEIIKNEEILSRPPINGDIKNYIEIFKRRESLYNEICDLKIEYADISEAVGNIIQFIN
ncbi:MAG: shikimate kinase [Oscillospiraceae bacterium]|nr:shikimate kinase [Oscillospiraceae bacterium]